MDRKGYWTLYRGNVLRSELEEDWAIHFDQMRVEWAYEPHTFQILQEGRKVLYTPDFFIQLGRRWHYWVEVKPEGLEAELAKAYLFQEQRNEPMLVIIGSVEDHQIFETKGVGMKPSRLMECQTCSRPVICGIAETRQCLLCKSLGRKPE